MKSNEFFYRAAAVIMEVNLADPETNTERIARVVKERLMPQGVRLAAFPELSISGYTCGDLFGQDELLDNCMKSLRTLCDRIKDYKGSIIVGCPVRKENLLYNCAVVISQGEIKGIVPKTHLPNYGEFYEKRWFRSGAGIKGETLLLPSTSGEIKEIPFGTDLLFSDGANIFGTEICEDLWVPVPPSCRMAQEGAVMIVNLSATDENIGKHSYILSLIRQQSARCRCAYIYSSAGIGESSTDLVFSGNAIIAENGTVAGESERFSTEGQVIMADLDLQSLRRDRRITDTFTESGLREEFRIIPTGDSSGIEPDERLLRKTDRHPFVPSETGHRSDRCREILNIQSWGLLQRLRSTGCRHLVVGISGGLDSTLALLVAVRTFDKAGLDRKGIVGITMPGYGTTDRTHNNAWSLMERLGVTAMEIPIGKSVDQHFLDINQDKNVHDATYENGQARERTQILMDMANKTGGMVLGTGDLSELALGWCTYNGDHMSMYGVNASVPKTLVKHLVVQYAQDSADEEIRRILNDIIDTPISPELIPPKENGEIEQKTEDLVGPYELHDFFLYHTLRHGNPVRKTYCLARQTFPDYDKSTILKWMRNFYRRFFNQQFKRSCMPDGPKVGSVCLSPRGDWRMPSDAKSTLWLHEVDKLEKEA